MTTESAEVTAPTPSAPVVSAPPTGEPSAVAQARQEEKDKLYKTLQTEKAKVKELTEELAQVKTLLAETQAKGEKTQRERLVDLEKKVEEMTAALALREEQLRIGEQKSAAEVQQARVEQYRLQKILELQKQGRKFPASLIRGNTIEEIDQTAEQVLQEIQELLTQQENALKATPLAGSGSSGPTGGTPAPVTTPVESSGLTAEQIFRMPLDKYAKDREEIVKQVGGVLSPLLKR